MGRDLQKKKNRSSTAKVRHKPKSKRINVRSNPIVAANWDQSLTLSQNYRRLGLASKLNSRTGGIEKSISDVQTPTGAQSKSKDPLSVSSKLPTKVAPIVAQIERDPETGAIIRVIHPLSNKENPLNDPLNDIVTDIEKNETEHAVNPGIIRELEEQATMEVKKRPRQQSKREKEWISDLVQKYGNNYLAMVKDRKLNPYQQSEGDLRRRIKRYLLRLKNKVNKAGRDAADREKAEKLAAAKKRFEQLKKQKEKSKKAAEKKKEDEKPATPGEPSATARDDESTVPEESAPSYEEATKDEPRDTAQERSDSPPEVETPTKPSHNRQPSLSLQSKMRSSSFRRTSVSQGPLSPTTNGSKPPNLPALSPEGDAVTEIYRKQASRLDELEKENKRLAKEAESVEARWRRTEEELEELRESSSQVAELRSRASVADAKGEEVVKLKSEITSLQRQISHLQSVTTKTPRRASISPQPITSPDLQAQLESKSSTIESMEMEISNLRTQLDKHMSSSSSHTEQVSALEEKLERAERAAGAAQRELLDARKNLDRASEKAVKEGSERTSAETRLRTLTREAEDSKRNAEESLKRVETLEKKLAALTTLHKDPDARRQTGERDRERLEKDLGELRRRFAGVENENLRLREERERMRRRDIGGGGADDDGLDELEDEERKRLEGRVRELEGEVFELRRGVWRERKRELQGAGDEASIGSPSGGGFDDVDLSGPISPLRRPSVKGKPQGFAGVLSSGFSAFTGGGGERASMDLMEGDDDEFDEDAFRMAQEEEGKRRVERIREVKRGLKDWEGWRMDIVDSRVGGGGAGEIFDV
ncbi:MAG: hypothetical protein Q9187_000816 [Circinaria calcarea]